MIVQIADKPLDHELCMEYKPIDENPKVFLDENRNVIGYVWFTIQDGSMGIKMIEMIEKEQGLGTEAVLFLFRSFPVTQINGQVLGENGMRAYWFWESLGACMSVPMDGAENQIIRDCYFTLERSICFAGA